jgi:hypothetical protein
MKAKAAALWSLITLAAVGQITSISLARADEGTTRYTTYYTVISRKVLDIGENRQQYILDYAGITRNDEGKNMFNNMTVHCVGSAYVDRNARKGSGACKEADGDGDEIFTTYSFDTANTPAGAHTLIGGTGKYKGITGKAEYTPQSLRGPVEGDTMFIVPHNVTWSRP